MFGEAASDRGRLSRVHAPGCRLSSSSSCIGHGAVYVYSTVSVTRTIKYSNAANEKGAEDLVLSVLCRVDGVEEDQERSIHRELPYRLYWMVPIPTVTTQPVFVQTRPRANCQPQRGAMMGKLTAPNPLITRDVTIQYVCIRYALLPGIIKQPPAGLESIQNKELQEKKNGIVTEKPRADKTKMNIPYCCMSQQALSGV